MSGYKEIIITPKDLGDCTIFQTNIIMGRTFDALITGTIYNQKCEPLHGAVIEVIAIYNGRHRIKKGYVITNSEGEFAIVVERNNYINYQLDVYEPLAGE